VSRGYTALRWKVVFLVLAKESFALKEATEAVGTGLAPVLALAAFSRSAWSFWALRLSPPILMEPGLGMKSLMERFSHGEESAGRWELGEYIEGARM
jgi:hypothetical protein